ncbi:haloalkane dehalogenase [Alphaproteobacteria bacterium]|jgi:haloalkane dehalogenase|nr:haloalkane dehalogenase [Alphaproteobacteria bacterium]|tara:strand:- start:209 stop:1069 length:861 start_codon:yes stop_codon:yes gene_type:complete
MNKKFIKIKNKNIAYIDEGKGNILLFIHGNPTSSYLWRNIINSLKNNYRCIAPDLIGMGGSDKLDNPSQENYSLKEHIKWFDDFINGIKLDKKIILVIHDWGSAIGFDFAKKYPERIAGIVYMEAIVCPMKWSDWPENATKVFKLMRSDAGEELILEKNIFVERILPSSIIRKLSDEEMSNYRKPFLKAGSDRQPTLSWPRQIPLNDEPTEVVDIVRKYSEFMKINNIKKLFINADPGSILIGQQREFCRKWNNQKEVTVKGLHFIQEDSPQDISNEIDIWIKQKS